MMKGSSSGTVMGCDEIRIQEESSEEMSRSVLMEFKVKEEEIERKKMEIREKVEAQLGRVEETSKRLAEIHEVMKFKFTKQMYILSQELS